MATHAGQKKSPECLVKTYGVMSGVVLLNFLNDGDSGTLVSLAPHALTDPERSGLA